MMKDMGDLRDAKILGGVGSILMLFAPVIGLVFVLIAAKYISDVTNDDSIFNSVLYAAIFGIIGYFVTSFVFPFVDSSKFFITILFLIPEAIFLSIGLIKIADAINADNFRRTSTLFLIGAILSIIEIGFIIIFIAELFMIIAFFSLPDQLPAQTLLSSSSV